MQEEVYRLRKTDPFAIRLCIRKVRPGRASELLKSREQENICEVCARLRRDCAEVQSRVEPRSETYMTLLGELTERTTLSQRNVI